jgi:uncharacterized membrane protein YqhA
MELVKGVLGTSRFLIILAVIGTFVTSVALTVHGLIRSVSLVFEVFGPDLAEDLSKQLIVDAVSIIDIFLLATVLYIISAGLYQLFVDEDLPLPGWLHIHSIDDLKVRLAGVIVVGLLVAFLGYVVQWQGGFDLLAPGLAIAAIIVGTAVYFRYVSEPRGGAGGPG